MDKIIINGGNKLKGQVKISGSKNAALPIMAASILTDQNVFINNVADLKDIRTMIDLLKDLGMQVNKNEQGINIKRSEEEKHEASYDLVSKMRASICVLGPLLGRFKKAKVSFPGGCVIGPRPIDLHLKAFEQMGVDIKIEHGFIEADASNLKGAELILKTKFGSSVLATANVMMAATLAKGKTIIHYAAKEPEIVDLTQFLRKMGANIKGEGTSVIEIEGVDELKGAGHSVIPDRIEAGSYLLAGVITNGEIELLNVEKDHLKSLIFTLKEIGQAIELLDNRIKIKGNRDNIKPANIITSPYPGFPTDMQAQMMAVLCFSKGTSIIKESIYPDRFTHISELNRMGANITFESGKAFVHGVKNLSGANVMASDLRASAALVLAGLSAQGQTEISRIYHLDRGYEKMEEKLSNLGADIFRVQKEIEIPETIS
ncbi:MAG: UDP-N-acetylglucosamine 1-carboxyvinyltransferase [bacterium]